MMLRELVMNLQTMWTKFDRLLSHMYATQNPNIMENKTVI